MRSGVVYSFRLSEAAVVDSSNGSVLLRLKRFGRGGLMDRIERVCCVLSTEILWSRGRRKRGGRRNGQQGGLGGMIHQCTPC